QKEIDLLKGSVADQKQGNNWFALTGVTSDGTEYYRVHHTNGVQWVTLRITFPRSKSKQYDEWVTRIDKEFVPFTKAEPVQPSEPTRVSPAPPAPQSPP
ncbi:MAG TPA: hypothetical protein VJ719_04290, partial [Chthoniobacterales bacterium]|nr:hypothetical protein [Chthoniobacterales bacterium]